MSVKYTVMEIIIVLGNRNPVILEKRVAAAVAHFLKTPQRISCETGSYVCKYLLLSGGSSDGTSKPEGAIMMEHAVQKHGIDPEYILIEKTSRNTVENLLFSKAMIYDLFKVRSAVCTLQITVCTSSFHIKRGVALASLIFGSPVQAVHTNEIITPDQELKEAGILFNTMNQIYGLTVGGPKN